ncbi:MAG: hypothetical protein K6357_00800 [Elusimicrobiota bacterium]
MKSRISDFQEGKKKNTKSINLSLLFLPVILIGIGSFLLTKANISSFYAFLSVSFLISGYISVIFILLYK